MPAGRAAQLEAQRREHMAQQLAVGLLVVDHQQAPARALVASPCTRRRCDARGAGYRFVHPWQEQPHAEQRALARRAAHLHLAAHQVGQHLRDGQAQARARRRRHRRVAARKGLEDALDVGVRHARPGVLDLDGGELPRVRNAQGHLPRRRELDRVAQQVDEDLAHAFFVGAHHVRQRAGRLEAKAQALLGRLQLEHVGQLAHRIGKAHRPRVQRELAGLDVGDGQRALDERQQVLAAALDHGHRLLAVRRHRVVFAHELRVAQDAVERRAQLVADGADVAALGLVREVRRAPRLVGRALGVLGDLAGFFGALLGVLQCAVGLAVQRNLTHQQVGLAVRFFLRHLAALVRQHQPPRDDARDDQQRHVGLEKTRAQ
ncbi:hypothetical protein D9M68_532190 [compost metagenome]